jgi:hypothetical protein
VWCSSLRIDWHKNPWGFCFSLLPTLTTMRQIPDLDTWLVKTGGEDLRVNSSLGSPTGAEARSTSVRSLAVSIPKTQLRFGVVQKNGFVSQTADHEPTTLDGLIFVLDLRC